MTDKFKGYVDLPQAPARNFYDVVPDDNTDLPFVPKGILVTVAGNIAMVGENGAVPCVMPVNANTVYPFSPQRIRATATTATGIKALH